MLIVSVAILLTAEYAPAQDTIEGKWYFTMNKKIDYVAMVDSASVWGYDTSTSRSRMELFAGIAAVVISRCEHSEVFFSMFENQVMLTTKRYDDPTNEDVQWGRWEKTDDVTYLLKYKNRTEMYALNELTGELYLKAQENNVGLVTKLLENNLKLVRKKGE